MYVQLPADRRRRLIAFGGVYRGVPVDGGCLVTRPDGSFLPMAPSLAVANHSPGGFAWGYEGSGPAQLALALVLDCTGDADLARALYQRLKREAVARWEAEAPWTLDPEVLRMWIVERCPGHLLERLGRLVFDGPGR